MKGASPLESGLLIIPLILAEAITGVAVGLIIHRTGSYLEIIYAGVAFMTIGNGLFVLFSTHTTLAETIIFQVIAGIGAGPGFQAPLIALQAVVDQDDIATATATLGFIRSLATSLSVVIGGVIFQNSMDIRVPSLATPPTNLPANIIDLLSKGGAAANVMFAGTIQDPVQKLAVRDAYAWSMRNMWILYTSISALAVVSSAFIKRHHLKQGHVETKTGIKKKIPTA